MLAPFVILDVARHIALGSIEGLSWKPLLILVTVLVLPLIGFMPQARRTYQALREIAGPDVAAQVLR